MHSSEYLLASRRFVFEAQPSLSSRVIPSARWALAGLAIASAFVPFAAQAANGVWTGATNNAWATGTNWTGGIPNAIGDIADFSQKDLTAAQTVNLAAANKTVGSLKVGDANIATPFSYTFTGTGGQIILAGAGGTAGSIEVVNQTATISTAILAGTLGFTKLGAGTLVLSNAANTFTGGITLSAGALSFTTGALNNNAINVTGTTSLNWNTAGDVTDLSSKLTLGDGVSLTLGLSGGAADNTVFASTIATGVGQTGRIVKANGGILTISAPQTYTGGTQLNNGRLILKGGDNRLAALGALTFGSGANGGTVQLGDIAGPSAQTVTSLAITGTGTNSIVGGAAANSTFTLNNSAAVTAANTPLLGGSGAGENNLAIAKSGAGAWTINKANTFLGDVTVAGGALVVASAGALGTGAKTVTISGSTNAPSVQLNLASGLSLPAGFSFVTSNDGTAGAIVNTAGANVIAGDIALADTGFGGTNTRVRVNGGSLQLAGGIAPAASAATDRTLYLSGAGTGTITGALADTGSIKLGVVKDEAGTWSLSSAGNYNGPTTVTAGRLNTTTLQTGTGALTVTSGATFGLTLAAAGQGFTPNTLAITGATLAFDLGSFANPTVPLITAGTFSINGSNAVSIAGTGLSVGSFPLVKYGGALGGVGFSGLPAGNLPTASLPARVTANLVDDSANSQVVLNISAFDVPKWTAAVSNDWDINDGADPTTGSGTVNWKEAASGAATRYLQVASTIDSVLFDDSAASTTVNLTAAAPLTPSSATINTAGTYLFTGAGKISGATKLTKQGSGTLILANTGGNDFTGATTISAGTLQLGDGVTANGGQLGAGAVVNNGTLVLNRLEAVTLANPISGSGTLVKQSTNSATLSGNNALFTGPITIAAGTLALGSNNALGSASGKTTVQAGATLEVGGGFSISEPVDLSGTLSSLSGISTESGNIALLSGHSLDVTAGTLILSGSLTGTVGLSKNNSGTLRLAGASGFSGGLIVNNGTVVAASDQAYTGGTTVSQGTFQIGLNATASSGTAGSGDIALNAASPNTATLSIQRGDGALNVTNSITSSGTGTNAVLIGSATTSGTVTFSGNNTFTGNVTINGGALVITNSNALGLGTKVVSVANASGPALKLDGSGGDLLLGANLSYRISSDGTIANAATNAGAIVNLAGNNTINGSIALINGGGGNGRITVSGGSLTLNGTIDANSATGVRALLLGGSGNGVAAGAIADWFDTANSANRVVSLTKDGAGTWTLGGTNSFTGAVAIQAGTLKVGGFDALGTAQPLGAASSALTLGTATTAATLEYTGGTASTARPISVTASSPGGVVKNSGSGELTLSGGIVRNNSTVLTLTGGRFDVSGIISGGNAAASVVLSGTSAKLSAANTYLGATRVQDGATLKNGIANALPTTTTLTLGEATNNTAGTYDLNGFNQTITSLGTAGSGSHVVTNGAASGTSTLALSGAGSFSGSIQDGATAAAALTKSGTGTFALAGVNSYTGPTTVTGGTLAITGSIGGTTSVSVNAGTLLLGGSDVINDAASITLAGGTLQTAGFSEGTLSVSGLGSLIISASSTIDFGNGASVLHFAGVGSSPSGTLNLSNWSQDADHFLVSGDDAARLAFVAAMPQEAVSFGGFGTGYAAVQFDSNNFEIIAVPEPSSTALLASLSLFGMVAFRERRLFRSRDRKHPRTPSPQRPFFDL